MAQCFAWCSSSLRTAAQSAKLSDPREITSYYAQPTRNYAISGGDRDGRRKARDFLSLVLLRLRLPRLARYELRKFLGLLMDPNQVLKPSVERLAMSLPSSAGLIPVGEVQASNESPVTCVCFGQDRAYRTYVLLATAMKSGYVMTFRCYHTELEMRMLPHFLPTKETPWPPALPDVQLHSRLDGHEHAVTSMTFHVGEDQLLTTSIDRTLRIWHVDSGSLLKTFSDSSPVTTALYLPLNPAVCVVANSDRILRLVNVSACEVVHKLLMLSEVRALTFDDTGCFLFAGTSDGDVLVLEATGQPSLRICFTEKLSARPISCITFVQAAHGFAPRLLLSSADSSVRTIDINYDSGPISLSVRHCNEVAHTLLPLKSCYSNSGGGFLISASEDAGVYIYSMSGHKRHRVNDDDDRQMILREHHCPVVAVAVNKLDTLIASADSLGRVLLWRRVV